LTTLQLIMAAILPVSFVTLVFQSGDIGTGFVITIGLLVVFAKLGELAQKNKERDKN